MKNEAAPQSLPNILTDESDWRLPAACRGHSDPNLFFPDKDTYPDVAERRMAVKAAKQICADCVIIEQCFIRGLNGNEYGIWGGTNERERNKLRHLRLVS
jgi:WhiB family redox-sensing transcriptional regulator